MNKLRFTSVLIITALIVTACGSDFATDEMEPEFQVKTRAMKKVRASGEENIPEEEEDTCTYYMWAALDTTIITSLNASADQYINVTCNEGFSNELNPNATLCVRLYENGDSTTSSLRKVELGSNGKIYCFYTANIRQQDKSFLQVDDYVTAQLKVKEIHFP